LYTLASFSGSQGSPHSGHTTFPNPPQMNPTRKKSAATNSLQQHRKHAAARLQKSPIQALHSEPRAAWFGSLGIWETLLPPPCGQRDTQPHESLPKSPQILPGTCKNQGCHTSAAPASLSSYISFFVVIHTYTHCHTTFPCPCSRSYTARCYFVSLVSRVDCKTSCRDRTAPVIGRLFRPPPSQTYMSICTWRYKL
jgi:hypothetical protein